MFEKPQKHRNTCFTIGFGAIRTFVGYFFSKVEVYIVPVSVTSNSAGIIDPAFTQSP